MEVACRLAALAAMGLLCVIYPHSAHARNSEASPGQHHAEFPNLVGVRAGYVAVKDSDEDRVVSFIYAGVGYERTLVHRFLELEISVPVAIAPGPELEVGMPIDVHLKIPFHPSDRVSSYIALGPSVDLVVVPELEVMAGGSIAAGTYIWFSSRVGIDVEIDYNLVFGRGHLAHEGLLATGPVLRF